MTARGLRSQFALLPSSFPMPRPWGLGKPVQRLACLNQGLVILTGAMGSGKSTTQACLVNLAHAHRPGYAILIQDSREFEFPDGRSLIRHKETGRDLEAQKRALRAALRQAPDILAVGGVAGR